MIWLSNHVRPPVSISSVAIPPSIANPTHIKSLIFSVLYSFFISCLLLLFKEGCRPLQLNNYETFKQFYMDIPMRQFLFLFLFFWEGAATLPLAENKQNLFFKKLIIKLLWRFYFISKSIFMSLTSSERELFNFFNSFSIPLRFFGIYSM